MKIINVYQVVYCIGYFYKKTKEYLLCSFFIQPQGSLLDKQTIIRVYNTSGCVDLFFKF